MTTTTIRGEHLAAVPDHLPNVGAVVAAIPTHIPVNATDPTEWIVLCLRTDDERLGMTRRFTTNRVQRLGDETLATGGHYDMTYAEAWADLLHRAGVTQ